MPHSAVEEIKGILRAAGMRLTGTKTALHRRLADLLTARAIDPDQYDRMTVKQLRGLTKAMGMRTGLTRVTGSRHQFIKADLMEHLRSRRARSLLVAKAATPSVSVSQTWIWTNPFSGQVEQIGESSGARGRARMAATREQFRYIGARLHQINTGLRAPDVREGVCSRMASEEDVDRFLQAGRVEAKMAGPALTGNVERVRSLTRELHRILG